MSYIANLKDDLTEREIAARHALEKKRLDAIAYLGEKWVLHPKHNPKNNGAIGSVVSQYQHFVVSQRVSL